MAGYFISQFPVVPNFSVEAQRSLPLRRCAQYGPGNPDLRPPIIPAARGGNRPDGTIPSCNLPRMTKDGASACSCALRTPGCKHVRKWRPESQTEPASVPSVLRSAAREARFCEEVGGPG